MSEETLLSNQNTPDDSFDSPESSRVSSILIGILLIVAVFLAFNFFQGTPSEGDVDQNVAEPTPVLVEEISGTETNNTKDQYTVQVGDTLWSIAESQLNDGFLWKEIAEANNISDSSDLEVGTVLTIPRIASDTSTNNGEVVPSDETIVEPTEVATPTEAVTPTPVDEGGQTQGKTSIGSQVDQIHVVERGETLWGIAEKYYGDGSQWHKIFDLEVNNLSMYTPQSGGRAYPLVHRGNRLVIPASSVEAT